MAVCRWQLIAIAIVLSRMNSSIAVSIQEEASAGRNLGTAASNSPSLDFVTTSAPSSAPSKPFSPVTSKPSGAPSAVPSLIRSETVSAGSSSSSVSAVEQQATMHAEDKEDKNSGMHSWSVVIPIVTVAVMAWAAKGNTFIRERATACLNGDICFVDNQDQDVPDEIVVSVVGENAADIELQPISGPGVPRQCFYRKSNWRNFPVDPVDEVSLKGSSYDCSSDEDDDSVGFRAPRTRYSRM